MREPTFRSPLTLFDSSTVTIMFNHRVTTRRLNQSDLVFIIAFLDGLIVRLGYLCPPYRLVT